MSIDNQVKELRELADISGSYGKMIINQAADTIEFLSAKLQAENNNSYEAVLQDIAKEIEEKKAIWSNLEKPPYNDFEQELYLSGLRKAREIILQAANMEQTPPYDGGWIPCSERLPEERDSIFAKLKGTDRWKDSMFEKTSKAVLVTVEDEKGDRATMTAHTIDGEWRMDSFLRLKVIAWQPLPEHMVT